VKHVLERGGLDHQDLSGFVCGESLHSDQQQRRAPFWGKALEAFVDG
jgi:hypothetical protein